MKLNNAASLPVKLLRYLLMAFVLLISLYPIAWVLINSFKQTPGGLGFPAVEPMILASSVVLGLAGNKTAHVLTGAVFTALLADHVWKRRKAL